MKIILSRPKILIIPLPDLSCGTSTINITRMANKEIELIAAQHGYYIYFVDDMWYDELGVRFAKEEL